MDTNTTSINYELTLETCPKDQLINLFADHPEIIHMKFWHGLSCLHKLCMRADYPSLDGAIKCGADVNAVNNFGETCLMFAAKRGSTAYIELLIQSGADLTATDKAGRSVIHHAVMGGSISLAYYLHVIHGCRLDVVDNRQQSALHIAACQGNEAMIRFLLRFDRCDPKKADMFGNTPLHHASTYGHQTVVHELLKSSGLSIIEHRNEKGQLPIDTCESKGSRHKETVIILNHAAREKAKGYRYLHKPKFLLFWYMFIPLGAFILGNVIGKLLQYLIGWYFGSICVGFSLAYVLYLFMVHTHRIKHYSRLPNPMHAGAFGAGFVGTFIVWLVLVLPNVGVYSITDILFTLTVIVLAPPSYYLYWKLLTRDPGYIPLPNRGTTPTAAVKLAMMDTDSSKFCTFCDLVTTGNVKHCKICERCVVHMDHHCLFLMNCVATLNHRTFTIFIFLVDLSILMFLFAAWRYFNIIYQHLSFPLALSEMATTDILLFWVVILNFGSLFWGLGLLQWNLRLISSGFTYYETLSHGKVPPPTTTVILTFKDKLLNLLHFFRGQKTPYKRGTYMV